MKKAFRKSLKRQASLGYFGGSFRNSNKSDSKDSSRVTKAPILWHSLARKYQFNYPKDWYRIEAHWLDQIESFQEQPIDCPGRDGRMNNAITRISQCNESYQLCNSLPRSFIVPKDLKDFTLMNTMSTVIKDHRVPIISYCCPIEYRRNFIIRCASSDQQVRVIETLSKVVKPLKVLNLTSIAPSLELVESAHRKLIDVCRPGDEQANNFISKSGKWLSIISLALKLVKETAKILSTEASVILIEDDDRGWNSVISSLVQIILEPHRRTIDGLESLISKEWIYLSGGQVDYSKPDLLFTLFLDCIYQIYLKNTSQFEFTSEYLRYLFEAQYICPATSSEASDSNQNNNNNYIDSYNQRTNGLMSKSKTYNIEEEVKDIVDSEPQSYKPSSISMVDLNFSISNNNQSNYNTNSLSYSNSTDDCDLLEHGYNISMFNPFYEPNKDSPTVEIHDHIANIKLWSSLYLRWQPRINYGCIEETIYFQLDPHPLFNAGT